MTLLEKYQQDIQTSGFQYDKVQAQAIERLERLQRELTNYQDTPAPSRSLWQRVTGQSVEPTPAPKGIYFWGGVGRGKTYMMDLFFDALETPRKQRLHFHYFMYHVHQSLDELNDTVDPLDVVAAQFKQRVDVLCFDEFFVSDITDAMILATLVKALFAQGIVLVATSNIEPRGLYRNGLQRARFVPAIDLIEQHCEIMNIDSGIDYRLRTLAQAEIYHYPLDTAARQNLEQYYHQLVNQEHSVTKSIAIQRREIEVIAAGDGVLFASFKQLCQSARSANDYIEMARVYHTVLLADVTVMDSKEESAARRFIALVDEFYERNVTLIMSAEVALASLYQGQQLTFEFERCCSRLIEMQSHDYLAREHLA
ncbi:cell division protein ZapE [Vibrio sp. SM6]|uniref:Cell division protein ZapE n=1 Tax=Vibrio agarilyticus TaxID=2726741 RepID=A0A7X8TPL4_9VIBR|nr:cell division protein ZapE [Vibrio agarilyticus]NLS12317.1 cell division protein ZapE [Vibrio agarilyticus]